MAKRFTDTEKWGKRWFRELSPTMKCVWEFLRDNCDVAGVWDIDMSSLQFHVGASVSLKEIKEAFGNRVKEIDDEKLFLIDYIDFQYGELSEECKPHKPVLKRLVKLNLLKGYSKGLESLEDKDKEKEKETIGECEGIFDLDALYRKYPKKVGRSNGLKRLRVQIKTQKDYDEFNAALEKYVADCNAKGRYLKDFDTFIGPNDKQTWRDWLADDAGSTPDVKSKPKTLEELYPRRFYE